MDTRGMGNWPEGTITVSISSADRIKEMPYNPKHNQLRFAVQDYILDMLEAEGVMDQLSDNFWEWWDEAIERPVVELICEIDGHEPVADYSNKPEYDYCAICNMPMPGQATHGR